MLLESEDRELFFKLHRLFMLFVNRRLRVLPEQPQTVEEYMVLPPDRRMKLREAWVANMDQVLIYADENPDQLSADELDIVRSWHAGTVNNFYILRQARAHAIFLTTTPPVAFGVLGLQQPFAEMLQRRFPILVTTMLLPFKGQIVYDGHLTGPNLILGPDIRRSLNGTFREAKQSHGIVTALPVSTEAPATISQSTRPPKKAKVANKGNAQVEAILGLIEDFCRAHLTEEYAVICRRMTEKLSRKRPSPLHSGSANSWASGIVRAVGGLNFLHDKTQKPHMATADIDKHFEVSPATGSAKSTAIRKALDLGHFDSEWTLPALAEQNPMLWFFKVKGILVDLRQAPRGLQEEAFRQGLIPFIPADRDRS